jgi:penicillin-binding protein 1C
VPDDLRDRLLAYLHRIVNRSGDDAETIETQAYACYVVAEGSNALDLTGRARSTGSILKPFIYAAAFDRRACDPKMIVADVPRAWSGFVPRNFNRTFGGSMTAAEALAQSRNLPALQLLARIGVEQEVGILAAAGFRTLAATRGDSDCRWRSAARRQARWKLPRRMRRWRAAACTNERR